MGPLGGLIPRPPIYPGQRCLAERSISRTNVPGRTFYPEKDAQLYCLSESRAANSKQPFVYERLPQGQGFFAVDLQHADRRAADSGAADEHWAVIAEMVRPFVAAGMEQPGQLPGQRV
jgi:hypothetical protein